ncbi:MAG: glutathione S-transferase [Reinekea sp.]|nr:glutathione S-transferase [Reinekea sp.]
MKLIGMLDSPFVRRTAIGLHELRLPFEHLSLSVFKDYAQFQTLNPLVKAPTLKLDTGETLVDSSLILQYAERISERSLYSPDAATFAVQQQIIGTASIANEKTVQIVYENELRPQEKQHQPWLTRIHEQVNHTFMELEKLVLSHPAMFDAQKLSHASIAVAVAWFFTQSMRPGLIAEDSFPALAAWSENAEATEAFSAYPYDTSMSAPGGMKHG